ncbi:MAG TPA: CRTAC1 family protein [Pyrinomonadaceae bacterium]
MNSDFKLAFGLCVFVLCQQFLSTSLHAQPAFEEISKSTGISFTHYPPTFDQKLQHVNKLWANFIAGAAVGDFNGDGRDDIFFVSSCRGVDNALYENQGELKFVDVTPPELKNLNSNDTVASGALWFDYDNDGWPDLLVLRLGHNLLFRNNRKGDFIDVTAASGLGNKRQNAISAIAFDYDRDGNLDLLVGGFFADDVDLFNLTTTRVLPMQGLTADNGGTKTLYRNRGDGTFTDVTTAAGIKDTGFTTALGHGDYDNDNWPDFYIANDFGPDKLYRNKGNGTFEDVTRSVLEVDNRKGMNVDFGDYNNDGKLDIYVTNITEPWIRECNMLWLNWGPDLMVDVSMETGTCDTGWGWGAKFVDFDNDGLLDIYVANGFISAGKDNYADAVERWQEPLRKGQKMDFADATIWPPIGDQTFAGYERNHLFRNKGDHAFEEIASQAGVDSILDSRGVALADFDGDGAMDILVTNQNERPLLYHNLEGRKKNWIELRLKGLGNRSAVGARVKVVVGGKMQIREINCGNGYQSQSSLAVHFGLDTSKKIDLIEIQWPRGRKQRIRNVTANQLLEIKEPIGRKRL